MPRTLDQIRDDALELSIEERGTLADDLWWSFLTPEEREIQKEWIDIAEARAEELRTGKEEGIPLADVMRRLRAKYSLGRRTSSRR